MTLEHAVVVPLADFECRNHMMWREIAWGHVESEAGAPTVGSGGNSVAFAPGLNPAPIVTFPAPAPRTRRADFRHRALQWNHAPRTRTAGATRACRGSDPRHHLRPLHGFRSAFPSRIRRAVEPVHASTTSNLYRPTPSLTHVMLPESSPSTRGLGIATPASSLPSDIAPHLRPLSSTGITRRLRSYGPLRHPDGPACPSRDSGWFVHTTDRASRVAPIPPLACVPPPIPRRNRSVLSSLASQPMAAFPVLPAGRLPHYPFRGLLSVHQSCGPHAR